MGELKSSFLINNEEKEISLPLHRCHASEYTMNIDSFFNCQQEKNYSLINIKTFSPDYHNELLKLGELGKKLKNEERIIINVADNGGGDYAYFVDFLKNLNDNANVMYTTASLFSPPFVRAIANQDCSNLPEDFIQSVEKFKKMDQDMKKDPVKYWEINEPGEPKPGTFKGTVICIMNKNTASAGESVPILSEDSLPEVIKVGENTCGAMHFGNNEPYLLKNSKIFMDLPEDVFISDQEEGKGCIPDFWVDSSDPVKEVISWLTDPDNYRFYPISIPPRSCRSSDLPIEAP
ncbi:MAG: S41 family peptidase [Candidatus Wallbacteria bacterium]|nr:S41 family peptidase [Candidatus Wallbacteria bacterium]